MIGWWESQLMLGVQVLFMDKKLLLVVYSLNGMVVNVEDVVWLFEIDNQDVIVEYFDVVKVNNLYLWNGCFLILIDYFIEDGVFLGICWEMFFGVFLVW